MLQEEAGRARHSEDIGIGGTDICVELCAFAVGVVVVHKRHTIAGKALVVREHLLFERTPVATAKGRIDLILHGEVEGSTLYLTIDLGAVDPVGDNRLIAVPALTDTIGGIG